MKSFMGKIWVKYKKIVNDKPYIGSVITISYTMIFAIIVVVASKVAVGTEVELMLNEKEVEYYAGNYDLAIEEYSKKESDKEWPIWTVKKAEIHSLKGEKTASNSLLEKAYRQRCDLIKKDGQAKYEEDDMKIGNYITFTYLMNGEYGKAQEYGEDFLKTNENNKKLRKTMVAVYLANGDKGKAKDMVDNINVDDNSYELAEVANLNIIVDNNEKAFELLKSSFEKDNNEIRILDVIEEVVSSKNEDSKKYIENLYNNSKEDDFNKIIISKMYSLDKMKVEEARSIINSISDANSNSLLAHSIKIDISKALNGSYEDSIEYIKEEYKNNYGANYIIAEDYLKDENYKKTIEYGMECSKLNGDYGKIYAELFSNMLIKQDNIDAIPSYLRRGMYYEPYNYEMVENAAVFYDQVKQNIETAYNYYKLASSLEDKRAENYYNMAIINMKKDDLKGAIKNLELLVQVDDSNDGYFNMLGACYLKNEDGDKAIEAIKSAYKINENNAKALNNAAIYYAVYSEELGRAYENMKSSEQLKDNVEDILIKNSIKNNYDTIKRANKELEDGNYKKLDISQVEILY